MLNLLKIKKLSSQKGGENFSVSKNIVKLLDISKSSEYLQVKNKLLTSDLGYLDFVLKETKKFHIRFSLSPSTINNHLIFGTEKKYQNKKQIYLKKQTLLLRYLFEKNERFPFFSVKAVKGGVLGTSLGSLCFVPKSLYKKDSLNQALVNVKLFSKRKRPFSKANLNFSLVSSLKPRKGKRKETF